VFDKASLAATGRAFEDDRQVRGVRGSEQIDLVIDGQVIRLCGDAVFFDGAFRHNFWFYVSGFQAGEAKS
jgi:hypothetical protein